MDEGFVRGEIRLILGDRCFLRVHRDADALYVTDFPLRKDEEEQAEAAARLQEKGYTCAACGRDGTLWALDMTDTKWRSLLRSAEQTPACAGHPGLSSLERLFSRFDSECIPMARMLLKWSSQKEPDGDMCFRKLSAMYALTLRKGEDRPGKGCAGLIRQYMQRTEP